MDEYRCPICRKPTRMEDRSFPFCSRRCKLIDLGKWADERYRIARPATAGEIDPEAGEGPAPPPGDEEADR